MLHTQRVERGSGMHVHYLYDSSVCQLGTVVTKLTRGAPL